MDWLALGIFIGMAIIVVLDRITSDREIARLNEMLAAKSYQEFKYYQGLYREELKELKQLRKEAREERKETFEEVELEENKVERPIDAMREAFEEDWEENEIEEDKLAKKLGIS